MSVTQVPGSRSIWSLDTSVIRTSPLQSGVNVVKLFSLSLMLQRRRLESQSLTSHVKSFRNKWKVRLINDKRSSLLLGSTSAKTKGKNFDTWLPEVGLSTDDEMLLFGLQNFFNFDDFNESSNLQVFVTGKLVCLYHGMSFYAMYVMLCHTIQWYFIPFHDMSHYAILCHGMSYYAMVCHTIPWYVILCHGMSYYAMVCHTMPWYVITCYGISCYAMVCHAMP